MKIAITGASGHLGTSVASLLLKQDFKLSILQYSQNLNIDITHCEIVKGSIHDPDALTRLLNDCDAVIHLAARVSINSNNDPSVYSTNFEGTRLIFDLAKNLRVKRFIHISSIHAFNQAPRNTLLDESRGPCSNNAPRYDQSKRDAQHYVLSNADEAMQVVVLNPTSIAGPPDYLPSLFGKAIIDLYMRRIPALIEGGFDFCDVRDVAQAVVNAITMGKNRNAYLLSGKWHSMAEVNKLVMLNQRIERTLPVLPAFTAYLGLPFIRGYSRITGKDPLFTHESVEALVKGNRNISSEKARKELNYSCRPFTETVSDLIEWFKENNLMK